MLKIIGRIEVDIPKKTLRARLSHDFIQYYLWLISRRFYGTTGSNTFCVERHQLNTPLYSSHVSIVLPLLKWNGWDKALKYKNRKVEIFYDPEKLVLDFSKKKQTWNFWQPVVSPDINKIKKELNIIDNAEFWCLHITICNSKNYQNQLKQIK